MREKKHEPNVGKFPTYKRINTSDVQARALVERGEKLESFARAFTKRARGQEPGTLKHADWLGSGKNTSQVRGLEQVEREAKHQSS